MHRIGVNLRHRYLEVKRLQSNHFKSVFGAVPEAQNIGRKYNHHLVEKRAAPIYRNATLIGKISGACGSHDFFDDYLSTDIMSPAGT